MVEVVTFSVTFGRRPFATVSVRFKITHKRMAVDNETKINSVDGSGFDGDGGEYTAVIRSRCSDRGWDTRKLYRSGS